MRELEGEPAEAGESPVEGRRGPGGHARRVLDRLLSQVLGREDDDHVGRLGLNGRHDVGLAAQDLGVGVIKLKAEVQHVLGAHSLEHEAGLGPVMSGRSAPRWSSFR